MVYVRRGVCCGCAFLLILLCGCTTLTTEIHNEFSEIYSEKEDELESSVPEEYQEEVVSEEHEQPQEDEQSKEVLANIQYQKDIESEYEEPQILKFVDVYGIEYETEIQKEVPQHSYDWSHLHRNESPIRYEDDHYVSRFGVDVSHHQGYIDWDKVKAAGVSFAFVRIGYRGYGSAGKLCPDKTALENIREAKRVGIDVGVYFFSQAVNEEEAKEEARFVLDRLDGIELDLPIVYDPETIRDDEARTDDVSGEQFTKNTIAFRDIIEDAGYDAMIYSNMLWEAFEYDLLQLEGIPIWYADYEEFPQTPYYFSFWQYTEKGHVDGINGQTDLNIAFVEQYEEMKDEVSILREGNE